MNDLDRGLLTFIRDHQPTGMDIAEKFHTVDSETLNTRLRALRELGWICCPRLGDLSGRWCFTEAGKAELYFYCTSTTYDKLSRENTRCSLRPNHEGRHSDGCLSWEEGHPLVPLAERFPIGSNFRTKYKAWIVTDVGSRVVVAIEDVPGWSDGPPYAVEEMVFDQDDLMGSAPGGPSEKKDKLHLFERVEGALDGLKEIMTHGVGCLCGQHDSRVTFNEAANIFADEFGVTVSRAKEFLFGRLGEPLETP